MINVKKLVPVCRVLRGEFSDIQRAARRCGGGWIPIRLMRGSIEGEGVEGGSHLKQDMAASFLVSLHKTSVTSF